MIAINIEKAKEIAHKIRRAVRDEKFAPLDDVIVKQIPGNDMAEIETQRQAIRDEFAAHQTAIDEAQDPDTLSLIVQKIKG